MPEADACRFSQKKKQSSKDNSMCRYYDPHRGESGLNAKEGQSEKWWNSGGAGTGR
jgi:hypothetical protein